MFGSRVNPSPGLKFIGIITFSSIQTLFLLLRFVYMVIIKLKTESQTINTKPYRKVTNSNKILPFPS